MPNIISGDTSVVNTVNTNYVAFEGGLKMAFTGTLHDSITSHGGHGTFISAIHSRGLQIDLTGTNGLASGSQTHGVGTGTNIFAQLVQGNMRITDFTPSDHLTLKAEGFKSGADAFAHLQSAGAEGNSILYLPAGGTVSFVHSSLTAASFGVA